MTISSMYTGPETFNRNFRVGPTEALVLVRDGKPRHTVRAGKYRRLLGSDPLGLFGEHQAYRFHLGETPHEVELARVPLIDGAFVDCTARLGLQFVDDDGRLQSLVSKISPKSFVSRLDSEVQAFVRTFVYEGLSAVRHDDVQHKGRLEAFFRESGWLVDGLVQVVNVHQIKVRLDEVTLKEEEKKREQAGKIAKAQRDRELKFIEAHTTREQEVLATETKSIVKELASRSDAQVKDIEATRARAQLELDSLKRAETAATIASHLGVPVMSILDPQTYLLEKAGHREFVKDMLGRYGGEFSIVADELGLSREVVEALLRPLGVASEVGPSRSKLGLSAAASVDLLQTPEITEVLQRLQLDKVVVGSSSVAADGFAHVVLVATDTGSVDRVQDAAIEHLATALGAFVVSLMTIEHAADPAVLIHRGVSRILQDSGAASTPVKVSSGDAGTLISVELSAAQLSVVQEWEFALSNLFVPALNLTLSLAPRD